MVLEFTLPASVRYVKLGRGGEWWPASRDNGQIHCGWREVDVEVLQRGDVNEIRGALKKSKGVGAVQTQDVNALMTLLDNPSRHLWVTFENGRMWWCLARDGVVANSAGFSNSGGHFWLECSYPWRDRTLGGRLLAMGDLPGSVTSTAAYRATVCEPRAADRILRIIRDETPLAVMASGKARFAYELAVGDLVAELDPRDFEQLIDLLLGRSGWARVSLLGGTVEGVDAEAENAALGEIAFVQVKSEAGLEELVDYVGRYQSRRDRYSRMIFAVHTERSPLKSPSLDIHVWNRKEIAGLVVKHGLGLVEI